MKQALVEAQKAYEKDEVPVGAVLVIQQKIIARAHNLTEQLHDVTAHAEMQAITSAANYLNGKYLKGCTLYVTLEPCVMCATINLALDAIAGCKERDRMVLDFCHQNQLPVQCSMGGGYSEALKIIIDAHANTYRVAREIYT